MKKITLITILILTTINLLFAGGPWPQQKGKGYFKLSESWIVFDQSFSAAGNIVPNVRTGIFNTSLYGEYGITDNFTGIINAPFFTHNFMDDELSLNTGDILVPAESLNSIGDIDLGLKYGLKLTSLEIPVSATLIFGLPTGTSSGGTEGRLQTGDGEFNQLLQIDAGTGFNLTKKINSYVSAYAGFNNRTNNFSDEFRYGLEAGLGFMDRKLWTILRIGGVESLQNGDETAGNRFISLYNNNTSYTSFTIEAAYYVTKRIGVSANFAGAWRGENIAAAPTYSFGVFYDLSR